jgi:hypothetical protein
MKAASERQYGFWYVQANAQGPRSLGSGFRGVTSELISLGLLAD